jgi:hypothetical protein
MEVVFTKGTKLSLSDHVFTRMSDDGQIVYLISCQFEYRFGIKLKKHTWMSAFDESGSLLPSTPTWALLDSEKAEIDPEIIAPWGEAISHLIRAQRYIYTHAFGEDKPLVPADYQLSIVRSDFRFRSDRTAAISYFLFKAYPEGKNVDLELQAKLDDDGCLTTPMTSFSVALDRATVETLLPTILTNAREFVLKNRLRILLEEYITQDDVREEITI